MAMRELAFLQSLDAMSLIVLFWYTTLLEIPRYAIGTVIVSATTLWRRARPPIKTNFTVSVVLAGHNEAKSLRACVEAVAEQTIIAELGGIEVIVVDDGSTDRMSEVARQLRGEGKIDEVLRLEQRGGKSAVVNLGISACTGDVVVISDIDTTFDRDAFAELLGYFSDPRVGAVSGNLGVRNASASLITRHQAIEYAIGLSLGRCIADSLGTLSIVSGAFGAFRHAAIDQVGRLDVEVSEDADLTMKLRRAGWRIRFAPEAHALTDVPETVSAFIAQRLRWDRGLITIWMRKFRGALDPRQSTFRIIDVVMSVDVIGFQVLLALAFPVYLVWLYYHFGEFTGTIIGATLIGYVVLNLLSFAAAAVTGVQTPFRLVLYLPLYTILQVSLLRVIRIIAIAQELIFRSSHRDPYVPARVMSQVEIV
jgi:cellulose synthase/poly-beta-1,6-N-acetylglucosamine synthase-like glycosyltransferase